MRVRNKIIGAMIFGLLIIVHPGLACVNPTDHFAAEVLLNKPGVSYNLTGIKASENVTIKDGAVVYRSHYNPAVAVILSEVDTEFLRGLSVRIQIPTQRVQKQVSSITGRVEENVSMGDLRIFDAQNLGWTVVCTEDIPPSSCGIYKGNIYIHLSGSREPVGVTEITLQVKDAPTLDEKSKEEISSILRAIGLLAEVEEVKFELKRDSWVDLEPAVDFNGEFDFTLAMRAELMWLRSNGVISGLEDHDVERISEMARAGLAGHNSRLIYDSGRWLPYARSSNPGLLRAAPDCGGFPAAALPLGVISDLISTSPAPPTSSTSGTDCKKQRCGVKGRITYILIGATVFAIIGGAVLYKRKSR